MTVNKAILLGNLGSDPEIYSKDDKKPLCIFTLATDSQRTRDQRPSPEWHRIVCFGSLAENCVKYLQKGREVYIEGEIQTRYWKDSAGKERISNQILAHIVQFVGIRAEATQNSPSSEDYSTGSQEYYITQDGEEELHY